MNSIKEEFIPFNLKCNNLVELEIKKFSVLSYRFDLIKKLNFKSLFLEVTNKEIHLIYPHSPIIYILKSPFIKIYNSKFIFIN